MELNQYIDHTLLKPFASETDYIKHMDEAVKHNFFAVCIPPTWVETFRQKFASLDKPPQIATVVGFPLGYCETAAKLRECDLALKAGANEIDFVVNLSWVKSKKFELIKKELHEIREKAPKTVLKVIIESSSLNQEEIQQLCFIAAESKIDFVKTSTGFLGGGAQLDDIKFMLSCLEGKAKLKASGGIKTYEQAKNFIDLGVSRLGCSSSIDIISKNKSSSSQTTY